MKHDIQLLLLAAEVRTLADIKKNRAEADVQLNGADPMIAKRPREAFLREALEELESIANLIKPPSP